MLLRWWGCLTFVLSVILVLGSLLVLQRHSWPGQPTEVKSWAESQHTYLWERSRSHNYPGSTYAFYLDCGPPLEPLQQVKPALLAQQPPFSSPHAALPTRSHGLCFTATREHLWDTGQGASRRLGASTLSPWQLGAQPRNPFSNNRQACSVDGLQLLFCSGPSIRVLSSPKRLRWAMGALPQVQSFIRQPHTTYEKLCIQLPRNVRLYVRRCRVPRPTQWYRVHHSRPAQHPIHWRSGTYAGTLMQQPEAVASLTAHTHTRYTPHT